MEVTHKQEDLTGQVTIKISKEDYLPKVEEELKKIRKNYVYPGFRPGRVPLDLIKKLSGKQVFIEKIDELVNQALVDFIKEHKLKLIGDFIPVKEETQFDLSAEKDYQFVYDYAVTSSPLINYEQIKVPFYKVEITDKDIDDEIEYAKRRYGEFVDSDEIKDDESMFYVTFIELDQDGNPKQDGIRKDNIALQLNMIPESQREKFIGKKKGDEVTVKLSELFPDVKQRMSLFNLKGEQELEQISDDFKLIITEVKQFKPADLDQELFKKYAPDANIEDEQAFREYIKKRLEQFYEKEAKEKFKADVKKALMNSVEVRIPEDFLLRWLKYIQERKPENEQLSEEELKKQIPSLVEAIKWNRILEQVAKDLDIKLEREDSIRTYADYIRDIYRQYMVPDELLDDEFIMSQATGEYDKLDADQRYNIDNIAFENKVLTALLDKVSLEEKVVTTEMFDSLLRSVSSQKENEQAEEQDEEAADQAAEEQPSESAQEKAESAEQDSNSGTDQDKTEQNTQASPDTEQEQAQQ